MLSEEQKQDYIKKGNYQYYGYKVISATIDTSSLKSTSKGIVWNPSTVNKGKLCNYTVTLSDEASGNPLEVKGQLEIIDIIETKQTNPSLVLKDISTNVVAGLDLEIQTSTFNCHRDTVMSKVLGCTIYNNRERESLLHCAIPTIQNYYEPIYPVLYMILSDKSIYIGITYRNLEERIYEHCTLTKDKTVKANKTTFDMIRDENAQVYCIGEFHDYTIAEIEAMSENEKVKFHSRMELVETIMITLASKEFSHLELVNKKQIINDSDELKAKVLELPHKLSFVIDWQCWDKLHEFDNLFKYSEGLEKVATKVYTLAHDIEISDSLISLYETVGVNCYDLANVVNNITHQTVTLGRSRSIDYNNPTSMPEGRAKDRFNHYFDYQYNPNPKFNKSKPYCKKTKYGWDNRSSKEMQEMVEQHLKQLHTDKRLYQAHFSNNGYFGICPMIEGVCGDDIFRVFVDEIYVAPKVIYVNNSKRNNKENKYDIHTTSKEAKLKSIDDLFNWDEEDYEDIQHDLSFLRKHRKTIN